MEASHEFILVGGMLGLISIFVGLISARLGAPLLLVFLVIGMIAGEDGPLHIEFDDFQSAYLIGSVALVAILLEGGLQTDRAMLRRAGWPALVLATVGVVVSAAIVAAFIVFFTGAPWPQALLIGAVVSPTDAATIAVLVRSSGLRIPPRLAALLEIESGLNDPISVVLTLLVIAWIITPGSVTPGQLEIVLATQFIGGVLIGVVGGFAMKWLLRLLPGDIGLYPVMLFAGALALFGAAQTVGASGFMAVYLAACVIAFDRDEKLAAIMRPVEAFGWLAQVTLFLMLGLLVTPHHLIPVLVPALGAAFVLIFIARPIAVFLCAAPFRFPVNQMAFASWVGLRGAVPIYLSIIPVLAGLADATLLFAAAFVIVIASMVVQGWTAIPVARLLRIGEDDGEDADAEIESSLAASTYDSGIGE